MRSLESHYIFFLTPSGKFPKWFISFSEIFSRIGIQLIPVTVDQLKNLSREKQKMHVIFIESGFSHRKWLKQKMKSFLGFAIKRKAINFYHVSSFGNLINLNLAAKDRNYNYFRLPIKSNLLAKKIIKIYLEGIVEDKKWPGGRSANLSSSISEQ